MSKARQLADLGNQVDDGAITGSNMVINGDMRIWQRGVGPISAGAGNTFCADRWQMGRYGSGTGVFTGEQSTDAPDGFYNSTKLTVTTTDIPSGAEAYLFTQPFEGLTIDPLAYETSSAKTITVSFWVKSSIVGTYAVSMQDGSAQRACTTSYSINSANTWEYKSVSIVGDTGSGSYEQGLTTKGGMIIFGLGGAGARLASTMNAWYNSSGYTISMPQSGGTNWISTSGATWQITGVCLNVGDSAIAFPHRSYGAELAACQRFYYQRDWTETTYEPVFMPTWCNSTSSQQIMFYHPVEMRADPTCSHNGVGNFRVNNSTGQDETCNAITFSNQRIESAVVAFSKSTANLTIGDSGYINTQVNNDAAFYIDAEL